MDTFYHEEYFEVNENVAVNTTFFEEIEIDPSVYIKVLSTLIIRAGLFITEMISIPSTNVQAIILHNIIDVSVVSLGYGVIGFIFAFGKDFNSVFGVGGTVGEEAHYNKFITGWCILILVSGLLTASAGDRISFFTGFVMNVLISCFTFPLFFHWILTPKGWMRSMNLAGLQVSYKDYSYSCLVHMAGGFVCFLSLLVLDRRMLRFKDLDTASIPEIGPNLAIFGHFLMLTGFFGFSIPTQKYIQSHLLHDFYGLILVNMIFAVGGTIASTILLMFFCPSSDRSSKWVNLRYTQGGISGVAVIAGGVDLYYPMTALCTGLVNGVFFFLETHFINKTILEDFCNITVVHFLSGFLGTLLPPILGIREGFKESAYSDFMHLLWQLLCNVIILAYLTAAFYPALIVFDRYRVLRTWQEEENHRRALTTLKSVPKAGSKRTLECSDGSGQMRMADHVEKIKRENNENQDDKFKNLDILYQRELSEISLMPQELQASDIDDEKTNNSDNLKSFPDSTSEQDKTLLPLFEEIYSESGKTSNSASREGGGDTPKMSKIFEIKMMQGIRNISDSRLFNKLICSSKMTKKRNIRNPEVRPCCGSVSNLWDPSTSTTHFTYETEV